MIQLFYFLLGIICSSLAWYTSYDHQKRMKNMYWEWIEDYKRDTEYWKQYSRSLEKLLKFK